MDEFLAPPPEVDQAALPQVQAAPRVVMQAVPFDPLAGPGKPRPAAKPKAVAARKPAPQKQAPQRQAPQRQADVPSLRVANEQY